MIFRVLGLHILVLYCYIYCKRINWVWLCRLANITWMYLGISKHSINLALAIIVESRAQGRRQPWNKIGVILWSGWAYTYTKTGFAPCVHACMHAI